MPGQEEQYGCVFFICFVRNVGNTRLVLRRHTLDDYFRVVDLWRDQRVTHFIGNPQTAEESWGRLLRYAGHWKLLGFGYWVIEEKSTGRFVGEVGLADCKRNLLPPLGDIPEIGWVISPESAGRGYATEAVLGALAWARMHLRSPQIVCIINPNHIASKNVALKCGFQQTGIAEYKNAQVEVYKQCLSGTSEDVTL